MSQRQSPIEGDDFWLFWNHFIFWVESADKPSSTGGGCVVIRGGGRGRHLCCCCQLELGPRWRCWRRFRTLNQWWVSGGWVGFMAAVGWECRHHSTAVYLFELRLFINFIFSKIFRSLVGWWTVELIGGFCIYRNWKISGKWPRRFNCRAATVGKNSTVYFVHFMLMMMMMMMMMMIIIIIIITNLDGSSAAT